MEWLVRSPDGSTAGELVGFYELVFKDAPLAPSGWSLTLPADHVMVDVLVQNGAGIAQTDASEPFGTLSGTVLPGRDGRSRFQRVTTGQEDTITFYGETDRSVLWARVALVDNVDEDLAWEGSGAAASVFGSLFADQFGPSGFDPSRDNGVFTTGSGTGTTIDVSLPRYDFIGPNLAAILAGEDIAIRTSYVASNGEVEFSVVDIDASTKPLLAVELESAIAERIDTASIGASRAYVLGAYQGGGPDRHVEEVDSSTDAWDLRETALDRPQITAGETAALISAGSGALSLGVGSVEVDLEPTLPVKSGDIVRVIDHTGSEVERYITSITVTETPESTNVTATFGVDLDDSAAPQSIQSAGGGSAPSRLTEGSSDLETVTITSTKWAASGSPTFLAPSVHREGRFVVMNGLIEAAVDPAGNETLCTLDAKYRPPARLEFPVLNADGDTIVFRIFSSGTVLILDPGGSVGATPTNFTWVV